MTQSHDDLPGVSWPLYFRKISGAMDSQFQIVILGGGSSGWMCAAALASVLQPGPGRRYSVTLVESEEIGTVGVGEATLPQIKDFNDRLGIDEADFMSKTSATFKLGIEFVGWGRSRSSYIHPFGTYGKPIKGVEFHQCWSKANLSGHPSDLETYSYAVMAARNNRFDFPSEDKTSIRSTFSYAYHFDAVLYASYLRAFAEPRGVKRVEGRVVDVARNPANGDVQSLKLQSGQTVSGDLFIDASGFAGLLIDKQMASPWEDWSGWLPCDRALAVPTSNHGPLHPVTRATARSSGWQWRIPLQHRTGNGYVYSSQFLSDERAAEELQGNLDGQPLADLRQLRFRTGRRRESWTGNVIAIGLASGFLEPLESTSLYLAQIAITTLLDLFPAKTQLPILSIEFNRLIDVEYERVRDFLILHYFANSRGEGAFWDHVRGMDIPDSLQNRIGQFIDRGYIQSYKDGLFSPSSWLAVLAGQDIVPEGYERLVDNLSMDDLRENLESHAARIVTNVNLQPNVEEVLNEFCPCHQPVAASA